MTQTDLNSIKLKLKNYIEDYPNLNNTRLAELFFKENSKVGLSIRSLRRYISLSRLADSNLDEDITDYAPDITISGAITTDSDIPEQVLVNTVVSDINSLDELVPYIDELNNPGPVSGNPVTDIYTDVINLSVNNEQYTYNYNFIDKIHCTYSKYGLNLTSVATQQLLNLTNEEYRVIVREFNITKECLPYSEYSKNILNEQVLYSLLELNVDYLLDLLQKSDGTITTKLNKLYKKTIILQQNSDLKLKSLFSNIKKELPSVSVNRTITQNKNLHDNTEFVHVFIPDMHIGMNQNNYNIDIIRDKLEYVAEIINSNGITCKLYFMGDIIHSVSGLNHKDSWKNMKQGTDGAEAIIQPYQLLLTFFNNINDLHTVNFVGGNHGRMASNKAEENTAEAEKLIAFMLNESFVNVDIMFDSYRIVDDEDPNMTVIMLHGDKPIDKASGQNIAWEYGNSSKFNYIAVAHMHSRKQLPADDGLRFRKESFPAFCPADTYSKTVAHGSMPGFKIVMNTDEGLPFITDIPLHYDK